VPTRELNEPDIKHTHRLIHTLA